MPEHRLFAALYDLIGAAAERGWIGDRRRELLASARGRVVELGAGTGANLRHYPAPVTELTLTEPDAAMRRRLLRRVSARRGPARVVAAPAERLPLPDESADVVVATLVLCSVGDQAAALAEARRVLRPGGTLLFMEHVRGQGRRARAQDRVTPLWRRLAAGCHPNRDTVAAIRAAGFEVSRLEVRDDAPGPPIARPVAIGAAVRP